MTRSCVSRAAVVASALLCIASAFADSCSSNTIKHYTRRSDSRAKYRQWVGNVSGIKIDKFEAESWYGIVSLTPGFAGTFKADKIADCLFGSECCDCDDCCSGRTIKVQGSAVDNRDSKAWLADYFYLPRNYNGYFNVDPQIKTFFMDIDWYLGMDEWVSGMYFRMYGSVVNTRWDLNFCDRGHNGNEFINHSCGYFSQAEYEASKLLQSFKDYACGGTPQASEDTTNNIKFNGLKYARMTTCAQKETGFADLRFELGWNFLNCEDYHVGINLQGAAPTGTSKKPCYLFDAMVGNGGHGELGAGLHGHYVFWQGEEEERSARFLLDLNVTTLFKKRVCRTFDLACKPNSAYMLAAKFGANDVVTPDAPTVLGDAQVGYRSTASDAPIAATEVSVPNPSKQFALEYAPVANLSTVNVDVRVGAQVDLVAMVNYTCENFSWDIGYDFWTLTCQKYDCIDGCNKGNICDCALKDTWALKGDARMFGYQGLYTTGDQTVTAVPLSATQCAATIYSGTNKVAPANLVENNDMSVSANNATGNDINPNIDSANYAFTKSPLDASGTDVGPLSLSCVAGRFAGSGTTPDAGDYLTLDPATDQVKTSSTPKFLSCNSLSMARTKGLSHTLFTHASWTFDREDWVPYLGVGAAVEFGQSCSSCDDCCDPCCSPCGTSSCSTSSCSTSSCCTTSCCEPCGPCLSCATSEWRVWVKGGLTYGSC